MNIRRPSARTYTNGVLTVIAAVLVLNWLGQGATALSTAAAQPADESAFQPDDPSGRISAAEQRKQMIGELRSVSARLDRIESALTRGISVKVTDMPAIKVQEPRADKPAK
jgi:hypothetical protein